ncbi:hypothetical protein AS149_26035 [Burkholderia cenocepacia]|nr:hypothetical protein AS149_26035 [Burkholderia cenocepacia]
MVAQSSTLAAAYLGMIVSHSIMSMAMSALFLLTICVSLLLAHQLQVTRLCTPLSRQSDAVEFAQKMCAKSILARDIRNRAIESGRELHAFDLRAMQYALKRPSLATTIVRNIASRG